MKIEQEVVEFQPITITLESVAEVKAVEQAINGRIEVLYGNAEYINERNMLVEIADFFEDV